MKICMLAPEFLPVWGGVGTYTVELVRHLPKDVEVHVVTPLRDGFGREKISTSDYDFSEYFGHNVHIHFVCKASDTFIYNAKFQYACLKHVPKLVKEENIDLIHSHTAHMPDLLLMFRKLNKSIVTTVHTTIKSQRLGTKLSGKDLNNLERSEKATFATYPALRLAEAIYFRRRRLYIAPSNWIKRWLENNFHINGKIRVIPNSIDINDYGSKERCETAEGIIPYEFRDRRVILYTGRLLAMKGMGTLIEAIREILKRARENELLIVFAGPGDRANYLKKLKGMKGESCCLFTGPLPRKFVTALMMIAELVVLPSFTENFPYTILESMACGTPVIASNVGGIPEIIENKYNGVLVEPGSPIALVNAIIGLLEDRRLRNLMGRRARETVIRNFSWKVNLNKYLEVYRGTLSQ